MTEAIDRLVAEWSKPEQGRAHFDVVSTIIDRLPVRDGCLLDIGCSKGYSTAAYAATGAGHAIGLEVERSRLRGRHDFLDNLPDLRSKISYLQGTSSSLPLADESVEGVVMNEALSHYQYPDESLSEAYRVLKPGGRIYVFDDNNALDIRGYFRRRNKRWPPYREEYDNLRREYFVDRYPSLDTTDIDELVHGARGLTFQEVQEALEESESPSAEDLPETPYEAPRHPEHGAYAEREINPYRLLGTLKRFGFEPELVPTHFSVTGPIGKFANKLFQWIHPVSLLLTPGFTILAEKPEND